MSSYRLDPQGTLPCVVAKQAASHPDRIFSREVISGRVTTYGQLNDAARRWAQVLIDIGVRAGDRVGTMVLPGAEAVSVWVACGLVGAIDAGINTSFRGRTLHYALDFAGVEVLVVHAALLDQVIEILPDLSQLRAVLVLGETQLDLPPQAKQAEPLLAAARPADLPGPEQWDIAALIYTSGTTGPPKAVLVPWGQFYTYSRVFFAIDAMDHNDVFYTVLPWYHTGGRFSSYMMAMLGGSVVFKERFQLSTWLDEVEHFDVTSLVLFPLVNDMLRTAPDDVIARLGKVRRMHGRWGPDDKALVERMSLQVSNSHSMTEVPPAICSKDWLPPTSKSIGRVRQGFPGFEARLVDEHDNEVPQGEVGELILRSATPWTMNAGYYNNPEATALAWRNGWFHTGDLMRVDDHDNFVFVDRSTDSIRRSGENISSWDVEVHVSQHAEVAEVAAVAAPAGNGREQEVKIVVIRTPASALTEDELHEFLVGTMPRFMVPRYIEFVDDYPRTPTMKIRKSELRANALNANTWDSLSGSDRG